MATNIPSQALGGSLDVAATRRRARRLAAVLASAIALGCAAAPAVPPEPDGPPPFQGMSRLVLLRRVDGERARPRDPLDAVAASLAAGGREAHAIDLAGRSRADPALLALYQAVEARVASGAPRSAWDAAAHPPVDHLGRTVATALEGEGVDGAVLFIRVAGRLPVLPPPPLGGPFGRDPALDQPAPPAAALALVDRAGNLLWFGWGGAEAAPGAMASAAEAVDALLRVIEGTPLADVLEG